MAERCKNGCGRSFVSFYREKCKNCDPRLHEIDIVEKWPPIARLFYHVGFISLGAVLLTCGLLLLTYDMILWPFLSPTKKMLTE